MYEVQSFAKEKQGIVIHLKMDSVTVVAYINYLPAFAKFNRGLDIVPTKEDLPDGITHPRHPEYSSRSPVLFNSTEV